MSHGAGLAMGLAALPLLVVSAVRRDDMWQVVAGSIYATTLVLLYSASTVYHALPSRFPAKRLFRGLDRGAIHLLIARASYTLGVYFYVRDHLRYRHFVWHLFVPAGSACHLLAVARYANGVAR